MARILCIETSSDICSVCICEEGRMISILEQAEKNHASQLVPMIDQLFKEVDWPKSELEAVAVSAGPGSFTGLRIGVASSKAICFAGNIPLIAVPSLQSLAIGMAEESQASNQVICPTIDAGRNEIYFGLYDQNGNNLRADEAVGVNHSLDELLRPFGHILIGGSGAEKCENYLKNDFISYDPKRMLSSRFMIELSQQAYHKKQFVDVASFEPFYLKPAYIKYAV